MTNSHTAPSPAHEPAAASSPPAPAINATVVRYRVKPGRAAENAELVADVYAELRDLRPEGLRYATFVLDDGVSFVHIAISDDDTAPALTTLAAFGRFRAGLEERCDEPPQATRMATPVGAYGF